VPSSASGSNASTCTCEKQQRVLPGLASANPLQCNNDMAVGLKNLCTYVLIVLLSCDRQQRVLPGLASANPIL